jgi:DNA mismatch repair protein MutL
MPHNYPFTALHFTIEPNIIDVNVHPQKMELRFSKNEFVYDFVYSTILDSLKNMDLAVRVNPDNEHRKDETPVMPTAFVSVPAPAHAPMPNVEKTDALPTANEMKKPVSSPIIHDTAKPVPPLNIRKDETPAPPLNIKKCEERLPEPFEIKRSQQMIEEDSAKFAAVSEGTSDSKGRQIGLFEDSFLDENNRDKYRVIGQLFETYWLVEFEDKFYIMDQHAAHEKVIYERMMKKISEAKADTQMIMPPVVAELSMKEYDCLKEHVADFEKIGFELEDFGDRTYKITGVPATLPNIDYLQLFTDLLDNIADENSFGYELLAQRVATMSCKAAIKGNNRISFDEAKTLIYELSQAENPFNCPHGRPTLIVMSKYEIEKKFKRII